MSTPGRASRVPRWAPALLCLLASDAALRCARAEPAPALPRVEARMPRSFGHHIGDLLVHRYTVDVPATFVLQRDSLPAVGEVEYWLELRAVEVDEAAPPAAGVRRYALSLRYQTFYAPLDVRSLRIPGFALRFTRGAEHMTARVPPWDFTSSPTLQVLARGVGQGEGEQVFSMPDEAPRLLATEAAWRRVSVLGAGVALWFGWMGWRLGWWRTRSRAPFAAGLRSFATLRARGDAQAYRDALRVVHRALDATHGRPLFADELAGFLAQRPQYAAQQAALVRFFERSRAIFFGDEPLPEASEPLFEELRQLLRECRRVERRG